MKNSEDFKKDVAATSSATGGAEPSHSPKPPDPVNGDGHDEESSSDNSSEPMDTSKPLETSISRDNNRTRETNEFVEVKKKTVVDVITISDMKSDSPEQRTVLCDVTSQPIKYVNIQQEGDESKQPLRTQKEVFSTSSATTVAAPSVLTAGNANMSNNATSVISANDDEDTLTLESSSDEDEDDIFLNQFSRANVASDSSDPELIIKRNTDYLCQRYSSLMRRLQGVMQVTTAKHVSRQLQSVLEQPGLNPALRSGNKHQEFIPPHQRSTKQSIAEIQFSAELMTNIIRHNMGRSLDPNDDSATEESDTDDEEVVLPDYRMVDNSNSEYTPYLPVENNPFIDAIKLEKSYETRRTSIEYSINECEYSLTKSLALRKHCKARKPCFQLEKPAASTNVINIPVEASSSRRLVVDDKLKETYSSSKVATSTSLDVSRVSEIIQRRPSQEDGVKTNGIPGDVISRKSDGMRMHSGLSNPGIMNIGHASNVSCSSSQVNQSQPSQEGSNSNDRNAILPSIKTLGSDGSAVVGVEFLNSSDPNQSASRCAAIKRPDKNRKVFQLGGIQNIFRDPAKLPSVMCRCYGRDELCALCLGRPKKKAEINHIYINTKDKLALLDETFHKTLSFSEDVPLEVLLTSSAVGTGSTVFPRSSGIQQLIKSRSQRFPPDFLDTGPRPKKPRIYDIKPYVESPVRSPKKENRFTDEIAQSPRKRGPRKSQSSFEERDLHDFAGKGLGWPRERKDSVRRTRNQEFDIDNIVIPYSMAATTRVEQIVYKPIETPRWRMLEYDEMFLIQEGGKLDGELEDLSNAAFAIRHQKCEVEEKKRFTQALQKAINSTRKTRRLDSTCKSESCDNSFNADDSSSQLQSPDKSRSHSDEKGSGTPQLTDTGTVITEAMANQALKSLFKVGRRRTISTTTKVEEDEEPLVLVEPWPQRKFPLPENEYAEMVDVMNKCYPDCPVGLTCHSSSHSAGPSSPNSYF